MPKITTSAGPSGSGTPANSFLRQDGVSVPLLPPDGTAADIQPVGPAAVAGSNGIAADSGHVHPAGTVFLCAPSVYAPGTQTAKSASSTTMAAFYSTSINTGSFTAPASGNVIVRAAFAGNGTLSAYAAFGLAAHGTVSPLVGNEIVVELSTSDTTWWALAFYVSGLTPGTSYNFDLLGCTTSSDSFTITAWGQASTTPTLSGGGAPGAPVVMTVEGI